MQNWRDNLVDEHGEVQRILRETRRIAVLGIKPESRRGRPAFYVPEYLREAGYEIVPVPVYYPEVTEILAADVHRSLVAVPGAVDLVVVFRRPEDIPPHVPDILRKRPAAVWFQLGIRHDEAAERLARSDIRVVQDRCIMRDHRRFLG